MNEWKSEQTKNGTKNSFFDACSLNESINFNKIDSYVNTVRKRIIKFIMTADVHFRFIPFELSGLMDI